VCTHGLDAGVSAFTC